MYVTLILHLALFSSLGVAVLLLARAVPRVPEEGESSHPVSFFDRLLTRLPLEQIDLAVSAFFEKTLRKLKVVILKIDNAITDYLGRIKTPKGSKISSSLQDDKELFHNGSGEKKG